MRREQLYFTRLVGSLTINTLLLILLFYNQSVWLCASLMHNHLKQMEAPHWKEAQSKFFVFLFSPFYDHLIE